MARIPKAQKGYCTKGGNCRLVATGKFKSNKASTGGGRLTRSEKKELEERNKIYDSPHYLIPEERKRSINYRKNRQVSESVETRRSTARRGIKIAKNGGKSPAKKLKKAQNGTKEEPTYKGLKWGYDTPTKKDSLDYKKGFYEGVEAKRKKRQNTANAFGTSATIRGYNEGYKKQRTGGSVRKKK